MDAPERGDPRQQLDGQLVLLEGLVKDGVSVFGDVTQVSEGTWALHGEIPVDRDAILAEYGTEAEARSTLDKLRLFQRQSQRQHPESR